MYVIYLGLYCSTLPLNIVLPMKFDNCCTHSVDVTCSCGLSLVYSIILVITCTCTMSPCVTHYAIKHGVQESFQMLFEWPFTNGFSNYDRRAI